MMTVTARSGLAVTLPASDLARYEVIYGHRAREMVLTHAGAALKNRRIVAAGVARLDDAQRATVEAMTFAIARTDEINARLRERGCAAGVERVARGGHMPPSWDREVSRASADVADDDVTVTDVERERAMAQLGLLTVSEVDHADRMSRFACEWTITAPDGWAAR